MASSSDAGFKEWFPGAASDASFQSELEGRGKTAPSRPLPEPTRSYWQDPESDIAELRSTEQLPPRADYVVVGGGISGASIAWELLRKNSASLVVVVEARGACSGATGRNGGHTKAGSYRSYPTHLSVHGLADAVRIARLESANIDATHRLCASTSHLASSESRACLTVDIFYDRAMFEAGKAAIAQMRRDLGPRDPAAQYEVFDADDARRLFLTPGPDVVGAFRYPAGSISAYKFATGILKMGLERGLNLQTGTAVTGIERMDVGERGSAENETNGSRLKDKTVPPPNYVPPPMRWKVHTERGAIETPCVILATNGYSAHLLPELLGSIVPFRGQVIAQTPGSKLRSLVPNGLPTTYSFIYADGYEYMIPRPHMDSVPEDCRGDIVIGGGIGKLPGQGISEFGNTDDTVLNEDNSKYLRKTNETFCGENWGPVESAPVKMEWSGIMGATKDRAPFVGPVPGADGMWISAGFNGHGMVLCLKCAEGLVGMIYGQKVDVGEKLDWFPRSFLVTEERLKK